MQHALSDQFEMAWAVADLVARHGCRNFSTADTSVWQVAELCGLRVYFEHDMPVRLHAGDLDMTLNRLATQQPLAASLAGKTYLSVHRQANARYTTCFRRGDVETLKIWADKIGALAVQLDQPLRHAA
jgi:hypothetical protein